jgi:hypothetical protein
MENRAMAEDRFAVQVACCGLVCSECGAFKKKRCQGCHSDRPMFRNCPVKKCVMECSHATCADCAEFADLKQCGKLHNWISRIFGFIFRSDRIGNLMSIRSQGFDSFKSQHSKQG